MNPHTLPEILPAIPAQHQRFAAFLRALPLETFLKPLQDTWSPLQHLQHLMSAERPFTDALTAHKFRPLGTPATPRSYAEIGAAYRAALEAAPAGFLVNNPFPPPEYGALDPLEATRGLALSEWFACGEAMTAALAGYSESDLDALSGRHPLLGWMPLRDFLLFMVYHIAHHQGVLERRLGVVNG